MTYHRGIGVGLALPTTLTVTAPSGTRTLDTGSYKSYAGPGRVTTSTCAAGTAPCFSFTGSIVYGGVRLSAAMVCGLTHHRGPTVGTALPTELGAYSPEGKGLVDLGTFAYYAGPAQIWDISTCPSTMPAPGHGYLGFITYGGTMYGASVPF